MTQLLESPKRVPGRSPVRVGPLSGVLRARPLLVLFLPNLFEAGWLR